MPTNIEKIRSALLGIVSKTEREEALKALEEAAQEVEWQPIETAPKDGKRVLVTDGFEVCDAYFRGGEWWQYECGDDWYSVSINPTNWLPLPQPPTMQGE